jgi:hypothetical protein
MAKKKKRSSAKKKVVATSPKHSLPDGFWSQVGAVFLIVFSLLLTLSWFGLGGAVLDWLYQASLDTIGYAVYVVPIIFIYIAVEIFRAEDNRLPFIMKFAVVLTLVWFAGLFGLLKNAEGNTTGGYVGELANSGMLLLVNAGVAAFVYIILVIITALFIVRVSPITIIKKIWEMSRRDTNEQDNNVKVMRTAAALETPKASKAPMALTLCEIALLKTR